MKSCGCRHTEGEARSIYFPQSFSKVLRSVQNDVLGTIRAGRSPRINEGITLNQTQTKRDEAVLGKAKSTSASGVMAIYDKYMKNNISNLKFLNTSNAFIIHYACNGLYNGTSPAPSISCILVCDTTCKHKRKFCINDYLGEYNMKDAEKILLQNFANFINQNTDKYFVHWNMDSRQYGFDAIKARCNEFGIEINTIPDKNKIDLSHIVEVIAKEKLTLRQVLFFNDIPFEDFLNGKEELKAFYDRNFGKISESVHNKVIGLSMIIEDINKNSLKTTFQSNFINQIATNDLTTSNYNNIEIDTRSEIFIFDSAHPILSWVASLLINR